MSRICLITGKRVMFGNNVSHSNRKTRRCFFPNLHSHKFWVPDEKRFVRILISMKGLRIINKIGIEKVLLKLRKNGIKI
ncbi:MAG TPA: 50S ribosomal protein L28 [Candidatus Azoamicus sp. OHIO1]